VVRGQVTEVELSSESDQSETRVRLESTAGLDDGSTGDRAVRAARQLQAHRQPLFSKPTDHKAVKGGFRRLALQNRFHQRRSDNECGDDDAVEGPGRRTCVTSIDGPKPWGPANEQRFPVIDVEHGIVFAETL
jgi:hypothetical protein